MPVAKMTKTNLPTLTCPQGKNEMLYWDQDQPGFGLRVPKSGRSIWIVQYRNAEGRTRRFKLGSAKVVDVGKARERAKDLLAEAQLGGDPQATAKAKRHGNTVKDVISDYLEVKKETLKPRSYVEAERALMQAARPLHSLKISGVGRTEITDLLDRMKSTNGPVAANRTRANLSAMWTWAIRSGRTEASNPVAATAVPSKESSRDRVLSDAELSLIWACTNSGTDYDRIVRLLLLTAARRDEIGAMEWSELSGPAEERLWTLPPLRAKNSNGHQLPLSALAAAQLPEPRESNPFVFGAAESPFSGWSNCKIRLDKRIMERMTADFTDQHGRIPDQGELELKDWRLHDLRRTFATWASNAGQPPHVVEAVLNHVSGSARRGIAGVYNKATYRKQKGEAIDQWSVHIKQLTGE